MWPNLVQTSPNVKNRFIKKIHLNLSHIIIITYININKSNYIDKNWRMVGEFGLVVKYSVAVLLTQGLQVRVLVRLNQINCVTSSVVAVREAIQHCNLAYFNSKGL